MHASVCAHCGVECILAGMAGVIIDNMMIFTIVGGDGAGCHTNIGSSPSLSLSLMYIYLSLICI